MKGRGTVDHINTITSIIETRKKCKLSTYIAFIDFKKAYDSINRALLFNKLENLGISSVYVCTERTLF
jgi:purine nucleoside phosphorylase